MMFKRNDSTASLQLARDKKLVRQLLAGNQRAFKTFSDEYFPRLYRYAWCRLGCEQDVEEVVQSALVEAARHIGSYRGEATLLTWLTRICRHEISHQLSRNEKQKLSIPYMSDDILQAVVESIEATPDDQPELASERLNLISLIQLALDQLPEHYGLALELKYIQGYSSREIAEQLNIGDEAVQSLLARARKSFRETCSDALIASLPPEVNA